MMLDERPTREKRLPETWNGIHKAASKQAVEPGINFTPSHGGVRKTQALSVSPSKIVVNDHDANAADGRACSTRNVFAVQHHLKIG